MGETKKEERLVIEQVISALRTYQGLDDGVDEWSTEGIPRFCIDRVIYIWLFMINSAVCSVLLPLFACWLSGIDFVNTAFHICWIYLVVSSSALVLAWVLCWRALVRAAEDYVMSDDWPLNGINRMEVTAEKFAPLLWYDPVAAKKCFRAAVYCDLVDFEVDRIKIHKLHPEQWVDMQLDLDDDDDDNERPEESQQVDLLPAFPNDKRSDKAIAILVTILRMHPRWRDDVCTRVRLK